VVLLLQTLPYKLIFYYYRSDTLTSSLTVPKILTNSLKEGLEKKKEKKFGKG
jgi:hypothetical protein